MRRVGSMKSTMFAALLALMWGIAGLGCSALAGDIGDDSRSSRSDSLYDTGKTYQRVENEVDRGTGRIVDQQTYELDRIDKMQRRHPQRPFEALEEDRDRALRIEANRQRAELDRRLTELMRIEPHPLTVDYLPPVFFTPLMNWLIEVSAMEAPADTQPASEGGPTTAPTTQPSGE